MGNGKCRMHGGESKEKPKKYTMTISFLATQEDLKDQNFEPQFIYEINGVEVPEMVWMKMKHDFDIENEWTKK